MKRRPRGLDGAALLAWMESQCVRSPSGCLEWMGRVMNKGYPHIFYGGRMRTGHRLSYTLRHGPIPADRVVMHRCDNRRCLEDTHHHLGTQAENVVDMFRKGRGNHPRASGASNGNAKLTEDAVRSIRKDTRPLRLIAAEHGISIASAGYIRSRQAWANLED